MKVLLYVIVVWLISSSTTTVIRTVQARLGPRNPPWPPVYDMKASLISMQVNGSGWSSPTRWPPCGWSGRVPGGHSGMQRTSGEEHHLFAIDK